MSRDRSKKARAEKKEEEEEEEEEEGLLRMEKRGGSWIEAARKGGKRRELLGGKLLLSTRPSSLLKNSTFSIKRERSGEGGKRGGERERGCLQGDGGGGGSSSSDASSPFPLPFLSLPMRRGDRIFKKGGRREKKGKSGGGTYTHSALPCTTCEALFKNRRGGEEELLSPSPFFET